MHRISKIIAVIGALLLSAENGNSQNYLFSGASSAGTVGDTVYFNCDFINPTGLPGFNLVMRHKNQNQSSFSEIPMTPITGDPHYALTNECRIYYAANPGSVQYYFRAGNDSLVITQSPVFSGAGFPPVSYFAEFAVDPAGDTLPGSRGAWLDLTGSGMTYSSSRLYGYLSNVSGTWPANNWDTLYLYAIAMIDPAGTATTLFAMVYINLFPFISPGLYKINLVDTSFTRIGNVTYSISEGRMYLSCAISDLTADPDWSGWPPASGYLISSAVTFTGTLSAPSINDFTYPTFYEPRSQNLNFAQNQAPRLFDWGFDQLPNISLRAKVYYADADNNLPKLRRLFFDRGLYDMGSFDHRYDDTSEFEYVLPWPGEGVHYYYYQFSDGRDSLMTTMDSIYLSGTGISEGGGFPECYSFLQCYPNPFNSATNIRFRIGRPGDFSLSIVDIGGRIVRKFPRRSYEQGVYQILWDGTNEQGKDLSSGIYFGVLQGSDLGSYVKLVLVR